MRRLFLASTALMAAIGTAAAAPSVTVTYEAPGVTNSTAAFDYVGVETFNSRPAGANQSFSTDFGTTGQTTTIGGSYSGVDIMSADVFGGAAGSNYAVTFSTTGYSVLNLTTNGASGINYFGYWLSALDRGNRLELISGGSVFYTFNPADVIAAVGACPNPGNAYCGNPVGGGNSIEPYVFVNFFVSGGPLDAVRFYEDPTAGGYESDNHTVGFFTDQSGTPVPEPASLALMSLGLLGLGAAARRRKA